MVVNFDQAPKETKSPSKLAHVVLRTNNFSPMVEFYRTFLGAKTTYENDSLAFLTYDEEHHRIAIVGMPDIEDKNPKMCGLDHIAFAFDTLEDLLLAYRQRQTSGINPVWSVNHGPTSSIYYLDPDENQVETQVDNFDTVEAANEFMGSKFFAENPLGTDFDPEELIRRLNSGETEELVKRRIEIGPRGLDDVPMREDASYRGKRATRTAN